MRRLPSGVSCVLSIAVASCTAGSGPPGAGGPDNRLSAEARTYLEAALDTLQGVTLRSDTLPWARIRDSAFLLASGAERPADTYGVIDWLLHRVNKHSFLQVGGIGAASTMLDSKIGYLHVPQRGGEAVSLADSLQEAVRRLATGRICGWIVDLRANGGGNMWPMLAGIGPLLGDTLVGSFRVGSGSDRWFYQAGVSGILPATGKRDTLSRITVAPVSLPGPIQPLALLFDEGTGSSGEATAVAFLGRPRLRTFGTPTAGFATTNRGARLPDGANMVVTVGYYADRLGRVYFDQVRPDTTVFVPPGWPSPSDRVTGAARQWLLGQPECR